MPDVDQILAGLKATLVSEGLRAAAGGILVVAFTQFLLTPTEYGQLFLVLAVVGVAQLLADLGLSQSAGRYVATYRESDPGQVLHVVAVALRARVVSTAAVAAALVVGRGWIAAWLGQPSLAPVLGVGAGLLVARSGYRFAVGVLQGWNCVEWCALLRGVESAGRVVFVVAFVGLGLGVVGAVVGFLAAGAAAAVVGLVLYRRRLANHVDRAADRADGLGRDVLSYGVPLALTNGANVVEKKVDTLLVGLFAGPVAVGFYELAKQVSEFVVVPAASFGFSATPAYGESTAAGDDAGAARLYRSSIRHVLLLYVPAAVGLVLVARPTVTYLFGEQYAGAAPVLQVFAGFVVVQSLTAVTTGGLDYVGRAGTRATVKTVTAGSNVLLNLALIPQFGALGAAAATLLTYSAYAAASLVVMHRELGLSSGYVALMGVRAAAIAGAMGVTVTTLLPYVSGVVSLFSVVAVGVGVWALLAFGSGTLDAAEVRAALG